MIQQGNKIQDYSSLAEMPQNMSDHINGTISTFSYTPAILHEDNRARAVVLAREIRTYINNLLQMGYSTSLTPEESLAHNVAREFIAQRKGRLTGEQKIHHTKVFAGYSDRPDSNSGTGSVFSRIITIDSFDRISMPWTDKYRSILVHEESHAQGVARMRPEGSNYQLQKRGASIFQPNKSSLLFDLFEEYAACAHQLAYYASRGYREEKMLFLTLLEPYRGLKNKNLFFELVKEVSSKINQEQANIKIKDEDVIEVKYSRIILTSSKRKTNFVSQYGTIVSVLDQVGEILFPDLPEVAAHTKFRDMASKIQFGAPHKDLAIAIKDKLGINALKFLVYLDYANLNDDGIGKRQWPTHSALLLLFKETLQLTAEEREPILKGLVELVMPRSKKLPSAM